MVEKFRIEVAEFLGKREVMMVSHTGYEFIQKLTALVSCGDISKEEGLARLEAWLKKEQESGNVHAVLIEGLGDN